MIEHTRQIIEELYPMNRGLLGEGYDNALEYIKKLISLDIIEVPSGTKLGTWTVPDEWVVRDAHLSFNGEKIIDYKTDPLSLIVGSLPAHGVYKLEEILKHIHYSEEMPNATPYVFKFYDKDWGFCVPKNKVVKKLAKPKPMKGVTMNGKPVMTNTEQLLKQGKYHVFIDTEYKPGVMKLGVHTIPGESKKEILLFAHLDHPFQANDNLSAVACLIDLATKLKSKYTIKIVFCPETIGSIAYAHTQDLSNVEFVIAVDICGNTNSLLLQKSFNREHRVNRACHLALQANGQSYRKGEFRNSIGSDETVFNDPEIGIAGIMLSTWPYPEYHTSEDTPDKIDYTMIETTQKVIAKTIEIYEKDYIPKREFKGPLMRSAYGFQTSDPQVNLSWDYLVYNIDGKRTLVELCSDYGINFDYAYEIFEKLINDKKISRIAIGEEKL